MLLLGFARAFSFSIPTATLIVEVAAMRLIDCYSYSLHSVERSQAPPYAVLSHTWTDDEVLFGDMQNSWNRESRKGWSKIKATCSKAASHGLNFAWVDTCCIDKSSSAELSENINSMFAIYAQASVCYSYLADFKAPVGYQACPFQPLLDITDCRWFTRGWTLQELIAPSELLFFDRDWSSIGSRSELCNRISWRTNIPQDVLKGQSTTAIRLQLDSHSIAMKMSWAAGRATTRPEDMAYSLLGIFDINMPMLYGEGHRAFTRLQEELIKESSDMSIFAWQTSPNPPGSDSSLMGSKYGNAISGILAQHPVYFENGHQLLRSRYTEAAGEFSMTSKGLKIQAVFKEIGHGIYFLPLHYTWALPTGEQSTENHMVGICLESGGDDAYVRVNPAGLLMAWHEHLDTGRRQTRARFIRGQFYIAKDVRETRPDTTSRPSGSLRISTAHIDASMLHVVAREPTSMWDAAGEAFVIKGHAYRTGAIVYQHMTFKNMAGLVCELFLVCGIEPGGRAWVCVTSAKDNPTLYNAAMLLDLEATYRLATQLGGETVSPDGMVGLRADVSEIFDHALGSTSYEVTLKYQ